MGFPDTYKDTASTEGARSLKFFKIISCTVLIVLSIPTWGRPPSSAGQIRGQVTDLFGSPIPNADIEITAENRTQRFQTRTDRHGNYEVNNLPAGRYTISVNSFGFLREKKDCQLSDNEQARLDFGLEVGQLVDMPPIEISGRVYQPNNTPLRGATIIIRSIFNKRLTSKAKSDQDGRYKVSIDNPGEYIVSASKPGYYIKATDVRLLPKLPRERHTLDFILSTEAYNENLFPRMQSSSIQSRQ